MTNKTDAILKQALELTEEERADLAGALLESLEPPADADLDAAWREEIARRVAEIDSGAVQTVRWDVVRDRLCSRLRGDPR